MDRDHKIQVLFLCTGNSARSILAEYLLRKMAPSRFETFSAGARPRGEVHPLALKVLREAYGTDAAEARSKPMETYRDTVFDFVITVCDRARESCPVWPGQPIVLHWGLEDPAAVEGTDDEKLRAFKRAAMELYRRLELFCNLPLEKLDRLRLEELTREIGSEIPAPRSEDGGESPQAPSE